MRVGVLLAGILLLVALPCGLLPGRQPSESFESESIPGRLKNCTTLIVGKDASADGSVMLAHNEDLGDYAAHHYIVVPREQYAPGEMVTTWLGAEVPQVEETLGYIATTIFDKSYVPGDITSGINEYQVAVANNLTYQREIIFPPPSEGRIIWTEYMQFALERARTAREAVQIMGALAQTYKHCGTGTLFGVTDPDEGWWIEIAQEGQWVAQRVPDDAAEVRANCYRIGEIDFGDPERFMYSDDLVSYAIAKGWYEFGHGPFDFTEAYAPSWSTLSPINTHRQWRAQELLGQSVPAVTPGDLMDILRDHYEGTVFDETFGYLLGTPHDTWEYTLCCAFTEVSVVCQSRSWLPAAIGGVCWRAMATPCTSVYTPWYMGILAVPEAYRTGTQHYTPGSAYWAFRRLAESVDFDYRDRIGPVRDEWDAFESWELDLQGAVEGVALEMYGIGEMDARWFLTWYSSAVARLALWKADQLAVDSLN